MPKRPTGLSAACFFPDRLRSGVVVPVFFPRGDPAADMALGLVHLQDVADTAIELWIDVLQAVGHVLMFRCDELERLPPSPDRPTAGGKCPHSHPCPLQSSG